ncbi:endolytic transglycosylase MltG [Candidatus Saccharibacteria bacterium]|nr:endolytic transglycosylase MltG [Candidatus Saccharibacteria bacterium]
MKLIGLDVGEKRIGVAKADSDTRIAVPVGFIEVNGLEFQEIAQVARMNNTNLFVIGLPRSNEGNETQQSFYVRNFANELVKRIPEARIKFQDESLTSVIAEERLKSRKKKYEKGDIDAEAASIILQDSLESLANGVMPEAKTPQEPPNVRDIARKQSEKAMLNTMKVKHKMKTSTKWISVIIVLVVLGLIGTGVALIIKEQRHQEYLQWLAEQEAQMEADVFTFMIRPGETIYEVRDNLIEVGYTKAEVDEALNTNYNFSFLQGRPSGATLEGYLFGETHEFYKSATAKEVIETFLEGMGEVITKNDLEKKYQAQGLSLYEGITLASVVQKEAASPEQPTVAQVFLSRLSLGIPLGSDVTVSYALDTIDPDRQTYQDNQVALTVDSCYNTRVNAGLPCGPISNPGLSALLAVANPSDSSYLYFLTGDDGVMYYSYTESEHNQNIASHCQELCNVSL